MNYRLFLAAGLSVCLLAAACSKKKDDPAPASASVKARLTANTWKFSKLEISGQDITASLPACTKDNSLRYDASGSYTISEGTNICNPTQAITSPYSLIAGDTKIVRTTDSGKDTVTIITLDGSKLVEESASILGTARFTYVK